MMKNACIVLTNGKDVFSAQTYRSAADAFRVGGYVFDELCVLSKIDEIKLRTLLFKWKEEYDNVLFLTENSYLAYARGLICEAYTQQTFSVDESAAGIFVSQDKTLILFSSEDTDAGVCYAKNVAIPFLNKKYARRLDKLVVRAVGANEAHVQRLIAQVKQLAGEQVTWMYTRNYDEDVIEIYYGENVSKMLADDVLRIFAEGLDDTVYALDDTPLATQLVQLLKLRGKTISVAESFTGGGLAAQITAVSGASAVYFEGLNTYNELSKRKRLGVLEYTLKTLGAVSDQTAYEMAAGLIATGDCDISVATTGLAGPNTDKSMLPIGLCYIAVGTKERVYVYRYKFDGNREEITQKAIRYALFLAYKHLKNI